MLISLFCTFFLNVSSGQMSTHMTMKGVVTQFDEKTIQLRQDNGAIVRVPRSAKPKMQGVQIGKDVITVDVSPLEFVRLNPKQYPEMPKAKTKLDSRLNGGK